MFEFDLKARLVTMVPCFASWRCTLIQAAPSRSYLAELTALCPLLVNHQGSFHHLASTICLRQTAADFVKHFDTAQNIMIFVIGYKFDKRGSSSFPVTRMKYGLYNENWDWEAWYIAAEYYQSFQSVLAFARRLDKKVKSSGLISSVTH